MLLRRAARALPLTSLAALCACAERTPIALTDPPVCVQLGSPVKYERVATFDLVKGDDRRAYFRCDDGAAIDVGAVALDGRDARIRAFDHDAPEFSAWEWAPHTHYLVAVHPSVFVTVATDAPADADHPTLSDENYHRDGDDVPPANYIISGVLPDAERVRVFGPHIRATTIELQPESQQDIGGVRIRRSGGSIRVDSPRDGHFNEGWRPLR